MRKPKKNSSNYSVFPITTLNLQMTAAATNLTPKSGISHSGKNGCITYLANVSPIIELVVGLQWKIRMVLLVVSTF